MCTTGEVSAISTASNKGRIAHGALMLLAWLLFSPVASFIARQLKQQLGGGKWFDLHRYMQVSA
jgi:hypothetical protein